MSDAASSLSDSLKLAVLDDEDLAVVSAHLQDAWATPTEMAYLPAMHRFALVVCRVDWTSLVQGRQERRRTGLHFERVGRVQRSGVPQPGEDVTLQLLAIAFVPTSAPAGHVLLTFSGGAVIKLEVECLEAEMRDLSEALPAQDCRRHLLDDTGAAR